MIEYLAAQGLQKSAIVATDNLSRVTALADGTLDSTTYSNETSPVSVQVCFKRILTWNELILRYSVFQGGSYIRSNTWLSADAISVRRSTDTKVFCK